MEMEEFHRTQYHRQMDIMECHRYLDTGLRFGRGICSHITWENRIHMGQSRHMESRSLLPMALQPIAILRPMANGYVLGHLFYKDDSNSHHDRHHY